MFASRHRDAMWAVMALAVVFGAYRLAKRLKV